MNNNLLEIISQGIVILLLLLSVTYCSVNDSNNNYELRKLQLQYNCEEKK
jgi:hypothetical protein